MKTRQSRQRALAHPDFLITATALIGLWAMIAIITFVYVVHESVEDQEAELRTIADQAGGRLRAQLKTQEAVLHGFAAHLASGNATRDGAIRYAAAAMKPYEHIYMLEVARRVEDRARKDFENVMRSVIDPFAIRSFSYDRSREWAPVADKPAAYPIVFLYPRTQDNEAVLGLDLDSVPHLRSIVINAEMRPRAVASRSFDLAEGGRAYLMLKPVRGVTATGTALVDNPDPIFDGSLYAMLICRTAALEPQGVDSRHSIRATLLVGGDLGPSVLFERDAKPVSALSRWLFPNMRYTLSDHELDNPLTLDIERQISWSDINQASLAAISLLAIASLALLLVFLYQMRQRELDQDRHIREMTRQALYDPVTGLASRILLLDRLRSAIEKAATRSEKVAVLSVNLEGMTAMREQSGTAATDSLLRQAASRITGELPESATIATVADNEFLIVVPDIGDNEEAHAIAEKLIDSLAKPFPLAGDYAALRPYLGYTLFPQHGSNAENLVVKASAAGFSARRSGWQNIARAEF